jgi:hypothetical protein
VALPPGADGVVLLVSLRGRAADEKIHRKAGNHQRQPGPGGRRPVNDKTEHYHGGAQHVNRRHHRFASGLL